MNNYLQIIMGLAAFLQESADLNNTCKPKPAGTKTNHHNKQEKQAFRNRTEC